MLKIDVVTLFPDLFRVPLSTSILGRADEAGLYRCRVVNLRDYAHDRHRIVDDYPYGGGAGMVLKPEPFYEALDDLAAKPPIVMLSARGRPFTHRDAVRFSVGDTLTLLCGHYKDVDARVAQYEGVEEVSAGDFVMSGGEFAALCIIDAVVRLLPGALGDHDSAAADSFYECLLAPPTYTRPAEYRGMRVPDVLLQGDHARIGAWRRAQAEALTRERRPDLWERYQAEEGSSETR